MAKWIPVAWEREKDFKDMQSASKIRICLMNSPFYKGLRYAVRDGGMVLSIDGQWEFEPMPSSRDDAFYERFRFKTFEDAQKAIDLISDL